MPIAPTEAALTAWLDQGTNHELGGTFAAIGIERIAEFLRHLPPPPAPVTVAGTKGKGSTVRLLEAALLAHGLSTLAFTSPHVLGVAERWRLDGHSAPWTSLADAATVVEAALVQHPTALTWFERSFALAVVLAAGRPGTIFLCEVGLGGRLDCANSLDAAVVVVTHLSHDHREVLGPTLHHIAREKLAVARAGKPLFIAPQSAEGTAAILANLPVGVPVTWIATAASPFVLALAGAHQHDNAATALAAATAIFPPLDVALARAGMATARLAARCQMMHHSGRRILIDGAHNGPSVAAAVAVASATLSPGWQIMLGLANDKEVDEVLAALPTQCTVQRCGYASPRARGPAAWPHHARAWPWHHSIAHALAACPEGDLLVVGSFYLAGEALLVLGGTDLPG